LSDLPDIQHSSKPEICIPIKQVGVSHVKVPIILESRYGGTHELLATVTMSTDLRADMKGISMSMLLRTLIQYLGMPLKHKIIQKILGEFKVAVEADSNDSYIKFEFEIPIFKRSPRTIHVFPQYYKCSFEGRLLNDEFRFFQKVRVQYASYCPCSASLCQNLTETSGAPGYPHAQRAFADVLVEVIPPNVIWLEDIIEMVESSVANRVYPILQRLDEQYVAKVAAENPMFVEDAIRRISKSLNEDINIKDWIVKCDHEESIHTSNAIAINWKGIPGGFEGTYYL
jgi:GTP cyclohydrolase IB